MKTLPVIVQNRTISTEFDRLNELVTKETQIDKSVNADGAMIVLDTKNFQAVKNEPWLLMLHAPWCGHCQQFGPIFESLGPELKNKVNVGKVDCTSNKGNS